MNEITVNIKNDTFLKVNTNLQNYYIYNAPYDLESFQTFDVFLNKDDIVLFKRAIESHAFVYFELITSDTRTVYLIWCHIADIAKHSKQEIFSAIESAS